MYNYFSTTKPSNKFITEIWVNLWPKLGEFEIFSTNHIFMFTNQQLISWITELVDEDIFQHLVEICEFNKEDCRSLWKIVLSVEHTSIRIDHYYDIEYDDVFEYEVLYKSRCEDFADLKANYLTLVHGDKNENMFLH